MGKVTLAANPRREAVLIDPNLNVPLNEGKKAREIDNVIARGTSRIDVLRQAFGSRYGLKRN